MSGQNLVKDVHRSSMHIICASWIFPMLWQSASCLEKSTARIGAASVHHPWKYPGQPYMYRNMLLSKFYREKLIGLIVDEVHRGRSFSRIGNLWSPYWNCHSWNISQSVLSQLATTDDLAFDSDAPCVGHMKCWHLVFMPWFQSSFSFCVSEKRL